MRAIPFLVIALALVAAPAQAGSEDERYSDFADATGFHTQKKMARAADGALLYTYVEGDANETEVVVVRVAADGTTSELPRVRAAEGGLSRPSLALDTAGDLHLAWTERADEDREVFAARFPLTGDRTALGDWDGITKLSGGEGYAGFPSLGATSDGRVHVAWYGFDGTTYQTFYNEWNGTWANAKRLSSGPLDANNPSLVVDHEDGIHIAWYKDEGRRYSVWYAHRAPDGTWALPRRLPQGPGDALNVALAIDASGRVHLVWDERADDGTHVLHALLDGAPSVLGEGDYGAIAAWGEGVLVAWAAPDGTLLGSDTTTRAAPLLGGVLARGPSLRGPSAGDPDPTLDVLWSAPEPDGFEIAHVSLAPGCSPWDAPSECVEPAARAVIPWTVSVALAACAMAVFRRPGHKG